MITNRPNFIPAKCDIQPEFYVRYVRDWAAVFRHPGGGNVMLVISTSYQQDKGVPVIQYQGSKMRYTLSLNIPTLAEALNRVRNILSNRNYGKKQEDPPVTPEQIRKDHAVVSNETLVKKEIKAYRKLCRWYKPRTPFVLTDTDKERLTHNGYTAADFAQIEECANKSVYILDEGSPEVRSIRIEEALQLLGRELFLSAIGRSASHWTTSRETPDGRHTVSFESGRFSPFRKNDN
jgi:hypothetical protein